MTPGGTWKHPKWSAKARYRVSDFHYAITKKLSIPSTNN